MASPDGAASEAVAPPDRRTAVLEAALLTFARFGYRRTSMEEVARAAHISRPGLYFLFASKETLFRASVTQALEHDLATVERLLADTGRPLRARLLEAFDAWAGRYAGPLTRDVSTVIDDNPTLLGAVVEVAPRRFAELITAALAVGSSDEAATRLAQTMVSTSIGIKHQVETREDYGERLGVALDLLLR